MGQKNILVIMSDDHAAGAISCYGSILADVFKTPHLDRIAREGMMLTRYYATNAICTPARATMMTGLYGHVSGVRTLSDSWDPSVTPNLAALLHSAGYQSAMFGKWHLHTEPKAFDEYKYLCGANGQGTYQNPAFMEKGRGEVTYSGYVTDIITDMTVQWLKDRDKTRPFFLLCHHKAPHDFWEYPARHEHLFDGVTIPEPESLFEDRSHRSPASRDYGSSVTPRSKIRSLYEDFSKPDYVTGQLHQTGLDTFEKKGRAAYQKYLKDYLRTVAGIDDSVGEVLGQLEREGVLDDTLVIYTSDQGMFLGEHDYQDKRWSFEESLRAPFLIRCPGLIAPDSVCGELICNLDFAPMLLDFAGVPIPEEMQGVSPLPALTGNGPVRDAVYFRYWMHRAHRHDVPAHFGVLTGQYKLTFYYGMGLGLKDCLPQDTPAGWELYDLEKDSLETRNVYGDPAYAEVAASLKVRLDELRAQYHDTDEAYPQVRKVYRET